MRFQPATDGVDDGETHLIQDDGVVWLFQYDGDLTDTHAVRQAMQVGIASDMVVDLEGSR